MSRPRNDRFRTKPARQGKTGVISVQALSLFHYLAMTPDDLLVLLDDDQDARDKLPAYATPGQKPLSNLHPTTQHLVLAYCLSGYTPPNSLTQCVNTAHSALNKLDAVSQAEGQNIFDSMMSAGELFSMLISLIRSDDPRISLKSLELAFRLKGYFNDAQQTNVATQVVIHQGDTSAKPVENPVENSLDNSVKPLTISASPIKPGNHQVLPDSNGPDDTDQP